MTAPTDEVQVQAARARWRADLLNAHAGDILRIVGDDTSPAAQAIAAQATTKQAEATIHLDHAEAAERLSIAKRELEANPQDPDAVRKRDEASAAMVELRSYWRGIGESVGNRRPMTPATLDNFEEPTDDEVLASHGGTN